MITHDGLICALIGTCLSLELLELAKQEIPRVLNFLPLAHMFGLGTMLVITYLGQYNKSNRENDHTSYIRLLFFFILHC